ncbi:phosphoglycerate mutase 2 [Drosophila elegans]|uniref:phosphoglycerate mutase 2 n=1 Tax=Drosophila elegans TaxID=30023 RepID=UPI001BC86AC3|nr:phosphoglycerate mutase 2 [Drosophila elegans]
MLALARNSWCGQMLGRLANIEARTPRPYSKPSSGGNQPDKKGKYRIVMVRHGESEWNQKNLFCGWFDTKLSEKGQQEACAAGRALKEAKMEFDVAHTSVLSRAQDTLTAILKSSEHRPIPVCTSWRLNERHYGGLTGLNKAETAKKFGEEKVQIWRRSFDTPPPPMEPDHEYYACIVEDPRYEGHLSASDFPKSESLKLTIERTLPYWDEVIVPQIKEGLRILVAAHGNSLRGVVKHLECISDQDIMDLNLPTVIPFVYELDENLKPLATLRFLGDPETVKKAMESVANQGKAK